MVSDSLTSTKNQTEGVVLWSLGHRAQIRVGDEGFYLPIPGKWRLIEGGVKPLSPGDRVLLSKEDDTFILTELLPRRNEFTRRAPGPKSISQTIAANLDTVLIVASIAEPETPFGLADRLLLVARSGHIPEVHLIINKTDLIDENDRIKWVNNYTHAVDSIIFTSCVTTDGVESVKELTTNRTVLLAGSSGVGKSTIANHIESGLNIKTGIISVATGKGRHVTSQAKLHLLKSGGWLTDTPGLRECAPWNIDPQELASYFPEMRQLHGTCRFRNCLHDSESGCNVKDSVGTDRFPETRYISYLKLLAECKIEFNQSPW